LAVLVLVVACDTTGTNEGSGMGNGKGMTAAEVLSTPGTREGLVKIGDRRSRIL
jgi:hypothetical protein